MNKTFYVNVFCDNAGGLHYSTEEFAISRQGLFDFEEAVSDACQFAILGDWRYICTLCHDEQATLRMQARLNILDQARYITEEHGRKAKNYPIHEMGEEAGM